MRQQRPSPLAIDFGANSQFAALRLILQPRRGLRWRWRRNAASRPSSRGVGRLLSLIVRDHLPCNLLPTSTLRHSDGTSTPARRQSSIAITSTFPKKLAHWLWSESDKTGTETDSEFQQSLSLCCRVWPNNWMPRHNVSKPDFVACWDCACWACCSGCLCASASGHPGHPCTLNMF